MSTQVERVPIVRPARPGWLCQAAIAVRVLLGGLLLTAACLKLYGLNVTAVPRAGWFATPWVQAATVVWELVLGFWLVSGASRAWSWLAAAVTFACFAVVSGYLGWVGVTNCGYFGVLRASPWTAFGLDVAALSMVALTRPQFRGHAVHVSRQAFVIPAGALTVFGCLAGVGWLIYGTPQAALARLRGDIVTVSSDHIDFGAGTAGQILDRSIEVTNWSDQPVNLIGGTSDCSCVTTLDLPLAIPSGETRSLTVRMKIPRVKIGILTRTAELWTDHDDRRVIRLQVGCRVEG